MQKIRRAIVSVSDKRGLVELAKSLDRHGVEILSTGGTAKVLAAAGVPTLSVAERTGAPEILEGRVKTLHPKIHGGLLGRPIPEHEAELDRHGIQPIDLVVVNLYPFRETAARPGVTRLEIIENIDIGGPSMLRSGAKNHERVTVVVDPDDYPALVAELEATGGAISAETRVRLAGKAFAHTAAYDAAVATFFASTAGKLPDTFAWVSGRGWTLRYGENPHQRAAFYPEVPAWGLGRAEVLQGKELSYNNYLDLDAALNCVLEFSEPAAVIVKHTNPCGVGVDAGSAGAAYRKARETDPISAFGGIVALNRTVDGPLARDLSETFLECVIAPGFDAASREVLEKKKNLRLLQLPEPSPQSSWAVRTILGGMLVQDADRAASEPRDPVIRVVTKRAPSDEELRALRFGWRVVKHVKSNAIVFARAGQTVGIGAGQTSRVDSVRIAVMKARLPLVGTVVASDAFFPFRDGVDAAAEAGATAVIQPGGSVRDDEVVAAADDRGLAMIFTGMRHFRH